MIYAISTTFYDKKGKLGTSLKSFTDKIQANKEYIRLKKIPMTEIKTRTYKNYKEFIKNTPKYIIE